MDFQKEGGDSGENGFANKAYLLALNSDQERLFAWPGGGPQDGQKMPRRKVKDKRNVSRKFQGPYVYSQPEGRDVGERGFANKAYLLALSNRAS